MKHLIILAAILISTNCFAQHHIPAWSALGKSVNISKAQTDVIIAMADGEQLFKTVIGQQLIQKTLFEGQVIYDHRYVHKNTFKALLRKKIIEKKDKNRKDRGNGEYILTERGEEIHHYFSS